ncbi:hypothetical protein QP185_20050 [Sphingomonas aerolata]|uniref:hypothetical protein n=1 Tax=Sphingomonas aerolata TaxID=185951 RepID=UPI002FE3291E
MTGTLLTGDQRYIDVWRRQTARINAQAKTIGGVLSTPTMHGADGWYGWQPGPFKTNGSRYGTCRRRPPTARLPAIIRG